MWCWSWADQFQKEVLQKVKEGKDILHAIQRREASWVSHNLRVNCLLKHVIEGKIEGTGRRGRRHKQLQDDLKERRIYWTLKEEVVDPTCGELALE
jgi:hypothetical protein